MADNIKILSSRRAYVFRPDDLRLTILSVPFIMDQIRQAFHFQVAGMGTPAATFGVVPPTFPPGLAFDAGAWVSPDGHLTAIRLIHVEPQRIVIDVAGPSAAIDSIFNQLLSIAGAIEGSSGFPVIGEPERVLDYSEITAHFGFDVHDLLSDAAKAHFERLLASQISEANPSIIPTIQVQVGHLHEPYAGIVNPDPTLVQLTLRAATKPVDHIYLSSAPLNSEDHVAALQALDTSLVEGPATTRSR